MKFVYAFFIGLCGAGSYAIINMLFFPHADPKIGLIFFAVMFLAGFVIGLCWYIGLCRINFDWQKNTLACTVKMVCRQGENYFLVAVPIGS